MSAFLPPLSLASAPQTSIPQAPIPAVVGVKRKRIDSPKAGEIDSPKAGEIDSPKAGESVPNVIRTRKSGSPFDPDSRPVLSHILFKGTQSFCSTAEKLSPRLGNRMSFLSSQGADAPSSAPLERTAAAVAAVAERLFPEDAVLPNPAMGTPLMMPEDDNERGSESSERGEAVFSPIGSDEDSLPESPDAEDLDPDGSPDAQRESFDDPYTPTAIAEPSETPPAIDLTRTLLMQRELKAARGISSLKGDSPSFNHERTSLTHKGVAYTVLTGAKSKTTSFDNAAVVSIGAGAFDREMILMNTTPGSSPKLEAAYTAFIDSLPKDPTPSIDDIFKKTAKYVHAMFPKALTSSCESFIEDWEKSHPDPVSYLTSTDSSIKTPLIPIDDYIEAKFGVCRHQALVACYFISKFKKDGIIPEGEVLHIRETLPLPKGPIGHVWVWYNLLEKKHLYHIDPMFQVTYKLHDAAEYAKACINYTETILDNLYKRFIGKR